MGASGLAHVVIMAGGVGTRLWPVSRRSQPKQFHALLTSRTMLEETYHRVLPLTSPERIWVVTGAEFAALVRAQLPDVPAANVLGEPVGRSSAPAAALAVARIALAEPAASVLVTPADSYLLDAAAYRDYVSVALQAAQAGAIAVLGVIPTSANPNYGYIKRGARLEKPVSAYQVERFIEKPGPQLAAQFLADGGYYWNMGHFVFRAGVFMRKCEQYLPEVAQGARRLAEADDPTGALLAEVYATLPTISLDHGIAEKEPSLAVIPVAVEWSDLGNWQAVKEVSMRHGPPPSPDHIAIDSADCYVMARSGRLVVTIGVEGYVIVDTPDALLVVREDESAKVREVLEEIEKRGKEGYL